ncbi:MAG TPA: TonB-dependent receptor [Acidobacteriaceae bacterium]|nr:TonB-dependent receptor [Acidobacteriaceae bacterium]
MALILATALNMRAQTSASGTISGTVTDTTGAVVGSAAVVITDTDTGVSRTVKTNEVGDYLATFMQSGNYEVVIGGGAYGKVDRKNLVLTVGQTLTVDAKLALGSTATEVTVSSESPILDPEKTEVSQTLDTNLVANLPVNARNWSDFVLLTPNVTQDGGSGLISFHGISGLYNENYVDGANNNEMLFSEARGRASGAPYVYSADSIKEFQAETSNYSVEFGQAAGGQVNAITKSGTNAIHGDLFYYLRYPTLNALDPLTKYNALYNQSNPAIAAFLLTQPVHQQQQFGGSVGGPIIADKLFYFFTYDGFRRVGKALYTDSNTISQTASGVTSSTNTITPTQCPTTITATQCTNAINFLINESTAAPTRFAKSDLFFPRLDYHINNRNDAFVDFNFSNFQSAYGYSSGVTFSNSSPSTNGPTYYHERFLVGGLTTQLGKASVNQVHAQWGRDLETAGSYASGPSVSMGVMTYGMPNALPRAAEPDEHRIQLTDVFSTTKGNHNFKAGGDINLVHEVMINLFQGGGIYSYGEGTTLGNFQDWVQDAFAGQPGDTDPYAGYHYNTLVETVDQVNTAPGTQGQDNFWMKMLDGFAEDQYKVLSNLTITGGIRYDLQLTPAPGLVNHLFDPISSEYTSSIKNVTDRIQPRIGFSWVPMPGTVVRGGYGLFSALNQGSTYYAMRVENGVVQLNYSYSGCEALVGAVTGTRCPTPPTSATNVQFPNLPFTPSGPSLSTALYPSGGAAPTVTPLKVTPSYSFHGLDPNFVPPLAHEMNLSVERALPGKMSVQVGYVGTRGMRLPVFVDANLLGQTPHGLATYTVQNASNAVTQTLTVPVYLPSDRRNTSLASFNTGESVANTWYNSMAVTARRPFANGLEVLMNYTWAKATDDGQVAGTFGTFYGGDTTTDPNNVRFDNGPSDINVKNRMTLSFVYKPEIMESNKWVKNIVDGFQFSGAEIASSGEPISLGVSGTIYAGNTSSSSYADLSGIFGGAMSSSSGSATSGRPPQVGRNSINAPGFNDFDLRVSRNVPIYDKIYMQFAADAFNLVNHQIVTGVNSTYSTYAAQGKSGCQAFTAPAGSNAQGCFVPYTGTGLSAFGVTSSTSSSNLYTARTLQVSAKLFF